MKEKLEAKKSEKEKEDEQKLKKKKNKNFREEKLGELLGDVSTWTMFLGLSVIDFVTNPDVIICFFLTSIYLIKTTLELHASFY